MELLCCLCVVDENFEGDIDNVLMIIMIGIVVGMCNIG